MASIDLPCSCAVGVFTLTTVLQGESVTLINNTAQGTICYDGGMFALNYGAPADSVSLTASVIEGNHVYAGNIGFGAGLYLGAMSVAFRDVQIRGNNISFLDGFESHYGQEGYGAGMYVAFGGVHAVLDRVVVEGNTMNATGDKWKLLIGGGIHWSGAVSSSTIECQSCEIRGNRLLSGRDPGALSGESYAGGMCSYGKLVMNDSLIVGNVIEMIGSSGGGASAHSGGMAACLNHVYNAVHGSS